MKKLAMFVAFLLATPFLLAWWAFVLLHLWAWFITPVFGVPVPSIWMAMGITLFVRFIIFNSEYKSDNIMLAVMELHEPLTQKKLTDAIFKGSLTNGIFAGTLVPLFALGSGAIYHAFA